MRNVDDIYELSPLQQGIFFHSLSLPESGVYFVQVALTLKGRLDPALFQQAWQTVVNRHASLRTSFHWGKLSKPLQVVHKEVKVSIEDLDWRTRANPLERESFDSFLESDRRRGFDLGKPPLMRLTLIKAGEDLHRFIWSFHHLLLDGWSSTLIFKEVAAIYEAALKGRDATLATPRFFKEYILWLQEQDLSKAESFWRESLKDFNEPTSIAVARSPEDSTNGNYYGEQRTTLPADLTAQIKDFARQQQLTINTLVQGAWALLLNRYTGSEDVLFGVTVSGRPVDLPGAEEIIGLLINTLPARLKVPFDAKAHSWLREIQDHQLKMRQYEYSPLVEIQAWSGVERGRPLFESIVVFENHRISRLRREQELGFEIIDRSTIERTNYPLTFAALPGSEIEVSLLYDRRRFDSYTISQMLSFMRHAIEKLASGPDQTVSQIGILTEAEAGQILVEWNATAQPYRDDRCAHELIEAQAQETPDAVALVFGDQQLTYGGLNRRANQVAHYLQAMGVGPEVRVALFMPRSAELVIGLLGILKAGGAYLAIDPSYPSERIAYMLENSGVLLALTELALEESASAYGVKLLRLDSDWELIKQCSSLNPVSGATPDNLAYLIYTSGSTGEPKAVAVQHGGLCNLSQAQVQTFSNRSSDRVLQFASLNFDASIFEIMMSLAVGACLCMADEEALLPGPGLLSALADLRITNATLPPSALQAIPDSRLPDLKTLIVAGEACEVELSQKWSMGRRFFNAYGPTEATVWATVAECKDHSLNVPIGKPIPNTQVYVVNTRMSPVPVGVAGELLIGGVGVARGYLNRPDLTAARFLPNPFGGKPGSRLYKTGDLARYLPDGNIEFIGRIDYQVKVRGYRIELNEIEAVLSRHDAVKQAVVIARGDSLQDKRLVAYIVGKQDCQPRPSDLRSFLSDKLPGYMVPSAFVFLEEFPVTGYGKIDRRRLPDPDQSRPDISTDLVLPSNSIEEEIAAIWREVLLIEKVGIHDSFFELGGHSLQVVRVHNMLKERIGDNIAITDLFKYPTISSLASYLSGRSNTSGPNDREEKARKIEEGKSRLEMQKLRKQAGVQATMAERGD